MAGSEEKFVLSKIKIKSHSDFLKSLCDLNKSQCDLNKSHSDFLFFVRKK